MHFLWQLLFPFTILMAVWAGVMPGAMMPSTLAVIASVGVQIMGLVKNRPLKTPGKWQIPGSKPTLNETTLKRVKAM